MKKSIKKIALFGTMISMLSVGSYFTVLAENNINSESQEKTKNVFSMKKGGFGLGKGNDQRPNLEKLVSEGTIDQATADKISTFMDTKIAERQAEIDKVKEMTEEDCKAYFEANKDKKVDLFTELVSNGIITQDQSDAIKAAKPQKIRQKLNLEKLVSEGTIDQATADKISTFMDTKIAERQTEIDKVKEMTEEDRKAYFEANKDKKVDLFTELVSNGIITQDQSDAIKAAKPQNN